MKKWLLGLMLITAAARVGAYDIPHESWMGAYVGSAKMGYLSYRIDHADSNGAKGYRIATVMNNRLMVLGADLTQLVTTVVYTDDKYRPLREEFEMSSAGQSTKVSADFKKDKVECVLWAGDGKTEKIVPIPAGSNLIGDAMFAVMDPAPEKGRKYLLQYFNPLTIAIESIEVTVEGTEKLTSGGKQYETYVLKSTSPMGDMTVWQDKDGEVLQVKAIAGITMKREDKETAMSGLGGTAEDFAVLTSIKPNKAIPEPRETTSLDVVIKGLDKQLALSDIRQSCTPVRGKPDQFRMTILSQTYDPARSIKLPVKDGHYADDLASTPYIDYDVGGVKEQAKEIIGAETNAYNACVRIRKWIYANMRTRADIGITRSASDVLKSKEGVCRDYAILFAAFARAVGIPSRLAAGLVYVNGAFYYHAWVDCYVGQWHAFDATQPGDFVDATHIKMAEGSATSMFSLAKVIGNLKIDVKSFGKGWGDDK